MSKDKAKQVRDARDSMTDGSDWVEENWYVIDEALTFYLSALEEREQEWRDISTAPKDGTKVLLLNTKAVQEPSEDNTEILFTYPIQAYWDDYNWQWQEQDDQILFQDIKYDMGFVPFYTILSATHWMPIPDTAMIAAQEGGE